MKTEQPSPAVSEQKPTAAPHVDNEMKYILPVGRSGWAIAAGYVAFMNVIFFLSPLFAPLTLVFALLGWLDIRKHPEKLGKGRIYFACIMSILGLGLFVWVVILQ
jgi:hypothetical protein